MSFQDSDPCPHAALHHSLAGVSIQQRGVNERWKRSRVCRWAPPLCIWMQKITILRSIFTAHFVPSAVLRGHTVGTVGKASGLHDLRAITQVCVSSSTCLTFSRERKSCGLFSNVAALQQELWHHFRIMSFKIWTVAVLIFCCFTSVMGNRSVMHNTNAVMWNLHAKNERQIGSHIAAFAICLSDRTTVTQHCVYWPPVFKVLLCLLVWFFDSQATYTDCLCQVHMKSHEKQ